MKNFLAWIGGLVLAMLGAIAVLWSNGRNRHNVGSIGRVPTLDEIVSEPTPGKTLAAAHAKAKEAVENEANKHPDVGSAINALVERGKRRKP